MDTALPGREPEARLVRISPPTSVFREDPMAMRPTRWLVLVAAGTIALSACGSSSKSGAGASPSTASTVAPTSAPATGGSTSPAAFTASLQPTKLGQTLVDSKGMTLYAFKVDTKLKSNCNTNQ